MAEANDRRQDRPPPVAGPSGAVGGPATNARHLRGHRWRSWPAVAQVLTLTLVVVAVLVPVGAVGLQLAVNAGRLGERVADDPPAGEVAPAIPEPAAPAQAAGGTVSNLLANWSFEHDLTGWQTVGGADLTREPAGHTSGSAARVRAPAGREAGIAVARATPKAPGGGRYGASVWVRGAKGVLVKLCVFSTRAGRRSETEKAVRLADADGWDRLTVAHTVPKGGGNVGLEVLTTGGAIVVDEAILARW